MKADFRLSHVELELGRDIDHPFGDRDHAYHLYLPLTPDGRLDPSRVDPLDRRCRVRRRRPGQPDASGLLKLDGDGRLAFEFNGEASNRQLGFHTPPDRFVVGRAVAIEEDDGEKRQFQVIAIRPE